MDDDRAVVRKCLRGNSRAYATLVDRYQRALYNAAYRIVGNTADAEDVTQMAFVKAYEHLASYDEKHRFFSWIYRITVNEALNFVKRRKRAAGVFADADVVEYSVAAPPPLVELSDETDQALGELSPEERAIILLKHVEGFSYHEIGFIFDIPQRTVKSRLYTARQHLKNLLIQRGLVQLHGHQRG